MTLPAMLLGLGPLELLLVVVLLVVLVVWGLAKLVPWLTRR